MLQPTAAPQQRSSTLRKGCLEAVDEAIAGCSVDEFVAGFSGLPEAQRGALAKVLQSVQAELRGNMQTELDEMLGESGVDAGLGRVESLIAQQPLLPDGTRWCATCRRPRRCAAPRARARAPRRPRARARRLAHATLARARRSPLAEPDEASTMVAAARLPVKLEHKGRVQQTLRQVRDENAGLQQEYADEVARLNAAAEEINAAKAELEQAAGAVERWRLDNANAGPPAFG